MTDKKFSDEEIIKALECCLKAENDTDCYKIGCPARLENGLCFYESNYFSEEECLKQMLEDALSLINRQKAEIERLEVNNIGIQDEYTEIIFKKDEEIKTARANVASEILMHIKALMQIIILDYKEIGAFDNAEIVGYVRDHLLTELEKRYTEETK